MRKDGFWKLEEPAEYLYEVDMESPCASFQTTKGKVPYDGRVDAAKSATLITGSVTVANHCKTT